MTSEQRAIIQWAAAHAPDVPDHCIAVSLGVPLRSVRRLTRGIAPETSGRAGEYRAIIGRLTDELRSKGAKMSEIAEVAQCTRQHLHKCREEARRG